MNVPTVRHRRVIGTLTCALFLLVTAGTCAFAAQVSTPSSAGDPHYTQAGFFDIHVCNWPDRPLFFMTLFSTERFADLRAVDVMRPDGKTLGSISLERFRLVKRSGRPEKRVFIAQLDVPPGAPEGWYSARATLKNGEQIEARDYVIIEAMQRVRNPHPAPNAEVPVPKILTWDPIPGAKHYQVFLRDKWDGDRLIHTSRLLNQPRLVLPSGLLQTDGYYSWRVHARDVNENVLLGDFNHGTLSAEMEFSTTTP